MAQDINYEKELFKVFSDHSREEIYRVAGKAIVTLSSVEFMLSALFSLLCEPVHGKPVIETFGAMGTFERRALLVDLLMRKERPEHLALWEKAYQSLRMHKGVRNLIAHHTLVAGSENPVEPEFALIKPWFKPGKDTRLTFKDIESTALALEDVNKQLVLILNKLAGLK